MWVTSEGDPAVEITLKMGLSGLISNSWFAREWAIKREREVGGLLVHALIPITPILSSLQSVYFFFFFFCILTCFPFFSFGVPNPSLLFHVVVYCTHLWPFILPTMTRFTILSPQLLLACCGCPSKTAHWFVGCLTTTTTLCWLRHTSFPDKSSFVLFFASLDTPIWIRAKFLFYQPL